MKRHFFVSDVPQTSDMDSGLAALLSVLEGLGISVSRRRLGETFQTTAEMPTIDKLQEAAVQYGLETELAMVPVDHLLLPKAQNLPAIIVARQTSGRSHPHFLVIWNKLGRFLQVMDPATGRRVLTYQRLLDDLDIHTRSIPAKDWRDWAGSDEFSGLLRQRLLNLKLAEPDVARLVDAAMEDPSWRSLAALDAATRLIDVSVRAGGLDSGMQAKKQIEQLFQQARETPSDNDQVVERIIPSLYWSVLPQPLESTRDHPSRAS